MSHDLSDLKAHLEKDGARYVPPFLLWLDTGQVVAGHVVRGQVAWHGALDPAAARELAAELLSFADAAEAEARALAAQEPEEAGRA